MPGDIGRRGGLAREPSLRVDGFPASSNRAGAPRQWRARVADAARGRRRADALALRFDVEPARWVDLDSLVGPVLAGLRDAGVLAPRLANLDAFLAERRRGTPPGVEITWLRAADVDAATPPGPPLVTVTGARVPRPGQVATKRAWRDEIAAAWGGRPPAAGQVWTEVRLGVGGSLLGPLEVVLDALEPVLGRDPRGRSWQEFFPNDHVIHWLRVRRDAAAPVRLTLGRYG